MVLNIENLVGQKYGLLIIKSAFRDPKKRIKCLVKCECGNERECYYSNLRCGKTKSCGHLEKANRLRYIDMVGEQYGKLVVLEKTEQRKDQMIVWKCLCSCGQTVFANRKQLLRGYVKQCPYHNDRKLIGKTFGLLKVLDFNSTDKTLYCRCTCGNELSVLKYNLLNGHTKSCGCLQKEENRTCINGTIIECLKSKMYKNNTSGVKGVYRYKGKWSAYITFQGKRHYLGIFDDLNDAALARKQGEDKYFSPLLKKISD